jgi:hypothetical protein
MRMTIPKKRDSSGTRALYIVRPASPGLTNRVTSKPLDDKRIGQVLEHVRARADCQHVVLLKSG